MLLSLNTMHFSYNTYRYAAVFIPLALLAFCLVGLLIAVYAIILIRWPLKKKFQEFASEEFPEKLVTEFRGNKIPCWTFIFGGLKLIYGYQIKECEHPHHDNIYTICGRHVRPWLLAVLFLVVVFVYSCATVAFWCEFLIDEATHCDEHMDCFARNHTTMLDLFGDGQPLQNCSEYQELNYTIHCFRFSLDYANALGDAGGVLVLASIIMNVQAGMWIGASSQQGNCMWYLAVAGVTTANVVVLVIVMATPFVVQFTPLLRERITSTERTIVQFYTYWVTFLFTFTISGPLFIIFSKKLRYQTEIDGEEQYVSVNSGRRIRMSRSAANSGSEDSYDEVDAKDRSKKRGKKDLSNYGAV